MTDATASPPIAAIVYAPTDHIEVLLAEVVARLGAQGVRLGGVIQHDLACLADDPCAMELEDLASGERFALSQELGSGSEACRLDPDALARASVLVRRGIEDSPDLIVVNKFGGQEAAGAGLRAEMGLAVLAGIPLLTAVGERFLPEWADFTGGGGTLLEPTLASVLGWWSTLAGRA